jgi:putative ABC transport system ATP-binding protein
VEREIVIQISGVSRHYGEGEVLVKALDEVSLEIRRGEFVSLYGPSGSGKSTLLNVIGGLDRPDSGEVFVDGQPLHSMSRSRRAEFRLRHIGFVFQAFNLIPVLTARENVEFVMQLQGVDREERKERAEAILQEVGLQGLEERRPGELSGGQQQRVAVARAIVSDPAFVLADEPTANLDSKTSESLIQLMKEMNEVRGTTFVFATHDALVMENAKRLIQLKDGRIATDTITEQVR